MSSNTMERTVVAQTGDSHTHTVIFLHGRDSLAEDLAEDFFLSKSSKDQTLAEIFPSVKWVFPTSKLRESARYKEEFGSFAHLLEPMSQWFDVWDIENSTEHQELTFDGLRESTADIIDLIKKEAEEVPLDHIILGGISQGCATAFLSLLSSGIRLGGFIGMCSWLPFDHLISAMPSTTSEDKHNVPRLVRAIWEAPINDKDVELNHLMKAVSVSSELYLDTPVFYSHSRNDEICAVRLGRELRATAEQLGFDVTSKEYEDGGHWILQGQGVDDLAQFMSKQMELQLP